MIEGQGNSEDDNLSGEKSELEASNIKEDTTPTISQISYEIWDNSKRASLVVKIFIALICFYALGIIISFMEYNLLIDIKNGEEITDSQLDFNDFRVISKSILQVLIMIVSIIVFINWFRRAYGNLHRLGISVLKQSESMALWCWFIPILSFFIPYQIMNEIHRFTKESIQKFNKSYRAENLSFAVLIWWLVFVITNIIDWIISKGLSSAQTMNGMISLSRASLIMDVIAIFEAMMVINIVRKIAKMEDVLKEEVLKANGNVVNK